jgi:hypothetical protein
MRSSFDLRLFAIFFLLVLIVGFGCERRPGEELTLEGLDNAMKEVESPKKQVRFAPEPTDQSNSKISRENGILEPKRNPQPQPQTEEGINNFQDTIGSDQKNVPYDGRGEESKGTQKKDESKEEDNTNNFQDTSTANTEQEGLLPPPPICDELLPPPVPPMDLEASTEPLLEEGNTQDESTFINNNGQEENTPPKVPTPPPSPSKKRKTPEPCPNQFPTIDKLNKALGVDISSINVATLEEKGVPTLEDEFKKIQQAYETVKKASVASNIAEDAKSRLNKEEFLLNGPRNMYHEVLKAKVKQQKEALLADVPRQLETKQEELIKIKQDIENGERTTMEDLSKKISHAQAELEKLNSQKPKVSQFKNNVQAFNKARQESETKIEEKQTELKALQKQESIIKQQVSIQALKSNDLEREIAQLKEEPKKIEERFNKQIQDLDRSFGKQTNSEEKSLWESTAEKIFQVQEEEEEEEEEGQWD